MRPIFTVAFMWLLTTGSSCQTTTGSNGMIVQSQNGATIAMVLVFAAYCLLDQEACGGGEPSLEQQLDAKFEENVRLFKSGDSAGLQGICSLAHSGYPKAQYFYGVHLFKSSPPNITASVVWLERASAQGHKVAGFVLDQLPEAKASQGDWEADLAECSAATAARASEAVMSGRASQTARTAPRVRALDTPRTPVSIQYQSSCA